MPPATACRGAIEMSRDRLCTVWRTVQLGADVSTTRCRDSVAAEESGVSRR